MSNLRITLTPTVQNPDIGDLYLDDSGQLEWIGMDIADSESYARMILQRIRCSLMFVGGEWYLDQRQGTPWRERIWVKGVTADTARRVIRDVVERTPGVQSIHTLEVSLDSSRRRLTVTLVAVADTGKIISTSTLDEPLIIEVPRA